jgi:hypothetical protein
MTIIASFFANILGVQFGFQVNALKIRVVVQ